MNATSHRPRLGALAVLAVALGAVAACPLPQPLPGVTRIDGGTITPPRIAVASAQPSDTIIHYDETACGKTGTQGFTLGVSIVDQNTDELVDVRWFLDYAPNTPTVYTWGPEQSIPAPADPEQFTRALTPRTFNPVLEPFIVGLSPPHVVEVVVTNGVWADTPLPSRSVAPGYEVEIFRWVFQPGPAGSGCGP